MASVVFIVSKESQSVQVVHRQSTELTGLEWPHSYTITTLDHDHFSDILTKKIQFLETPGSMAKGAGSAGCSCD